MILDDIQNRRIAHPLGCSTMLRSESPSMRPCSPAMSEISVGSPSPPPAGNSFYHASKGFRPINMKRSRYAHGERTRSPFPQSSAQPVNGRKSSAERVKSFSIADILGRTEKQTTEPTIETTTTTSRTPLMHQSSPPQPNPTLALLPTVNLLQERLQPLAPPPPSQLLLDVPTPLSKVLQPWDPLRIPHVLPLRPFLPPSLLHYEQRLSWDYQRQLQEHFQAQAQLLRQMSMDPTIIPSEDGSERSRSSSTGASDCCSPDVDVQSNSNSIKGGGDDKTQQDTEGSGLKTKDRANNECVSSAKKTLAGDTPLDALFQLSTKNFDEEQDPATLNIFATRPNPKKKRKSRTAFTNHQIFELEKRFLYQKYLSPADRDEIALGLGLSNAQVITWFQNRRAKLKRDMEELKKDVESVKQLSAHKSFLENVNDLSILKTRPVSRHHSPISPTSTTHPQATFSPYTHSAALPTTANQAAIDSIANIDNNSSSNSSSNNNNSTHNNATTVAQQPRFNNLNHSRG